MNDNERDVLHRDLRDLYDSTKKLLPGERGDKITAYAKRHLQAIGPHRTYSEPRLVKEIGNLFDSLD